MIGPFLAAADCAAGVLAAEEVAAAWAEPSALAGYTVGGLGAHLLMATERTEAVLDEDEPIGRLVDVAEFYGANRVDDPSDNETGLHVIVRDAAERMAAAAGASAIAERFSGLVDRLRVRLAEEPPDRLVTILQVKGGVTPLDTYLRTRIVELVVHADDLADSVGLPLELPPAAVDVAAGVFVELARARSGDLAVVRAFTRAERSDPDTLRVL